MAVKRSTDVWSWHHLVPAPNLDGGPDRVVLVLPAVGGKGRILCDGVSIAAVNYSWIPQHFDLTEWAGQQIQVEIEADPEQKFAGSLAAIDHPAIGLWSAPKWKFCGSAYFESPPQINWESGVLSIQFRTTFGVKERLVTDSDSDSGSGSEKSSKTKAGRSTKGSVLQIRIGSQTSVLDADGRCEFKFPAPPAWSPDDPQVHQLQIELWNDGVISDTAQVPFALSQLRANGDQLQLNGKNFQVRGLLHWGYYPDLAGPNPTSANLRVELLQMKARGFNLLKACLWLPNQKFLNLCDDVGMAVWIEYPLWDGPLQGGEELEQEIETYASWARHDCNHPCVILRTLTCENDRVDATAAQQICERIKSIAPNGLLNDNSAWLDCNHHTEFWDEHPYLHAAQWPWYLQRLQRALSQREAKPLILGETMAFDSLDDLDSRQAAVSLREEQATSLLQAFPHAGYVLCAARDIPQSPLGLQDQSGAWKTDVEQWLWQKCLTAILPTPPASEQPVSIGATQPESTSFEHPWDDLAKRMPDDVGVRRELDAQTIAELNSGAVIIHLAGPRPHSWRTPEHTFWSPVASWDACFESLKIDLFQTFLSGRALQPPSTDQGRILASARDVHDLQGAQKNQPFMFAAAVGNGRLLVSSLRWDHAEGQQLLQDLAARITNPDDELCKNLPQLQLTPPPRSFFLNGPWRLSGDGVRDKSQTIHVGTMLQNRGANAFQGWATAEAEFTLPQDWQGPVMLRAEGVGDGFLLYLNDELVAEHGRPGFTWDAGRDVLATLDLGRWIKPGQPTRWRIRTKDHRGAGGLIGPLYLCAGDPDANLLY
ncbi:MAG: hypothetical protein HQ519_02515 [Planctomycetes bacterium]|nr:hypothetical protein [Planctomycetota bacterium]